MSNRERLMDRIKAALRAGDADTASLAKMLNSSRGAVQKNLELLLIEECVTRARIPPKNGRPAFLYHLEQ